MSHSLATDSELSVEVPCPGEETSVPSPAGSGIRRLFPVDTHRQGQPPSLTVCQGFPILIGPGLPS